MSKQLRINWLDKFKRVIKNMKNKDEYLKLCIDVENHVYTLTCSHYGFSFNFSNEEREFFNKSASLNWYELSGVLEMHDTNLAEGNVVVYTEGDSYVFENVIQQRFVVPISYNNIVRALVDVQSDYDEFTTRDYSSAVNVGLLKKALSAFDNDEIVTIATHQDDSLFKPRKPVFIENLGNMISKKQKAVSRAQGKSAFVLPIKLSEALMDTAALVINEKEPELCRK